MEYIQAGGKNMWSKERTRRLSTGFNDLEDGLVSTHLENATKHERMRPLTKEKGDLADWMFFLDDSIPLSGITIPGTHDSAAYTRSWPFVTTQKLDILGQLNAGIRFFDFRCGLRDDVVEMVHGIAYLGLKFEELLGLMYSWLSKHPSEALIVQVKNDRRPEGSTVAFPLAILDVIAKKPARWRLSTTTPCIGELRGRIQLFRRFGRPRRCANGINVVQWVDNSPEPFTITTCPDVEITIQDHYTFPGVVSLPSIVTRKGGDVAGLLERANKDPDLSHWYMNFTNAFEFNLVYQIQPHQIAVGGRWRLHYVEGVNVRLRQWLKEKKSCRSRFGIVGMDFPEQGADDLIAALIQSNFDPVNEEYNYCWLFSFLEFLMLAVFLVAGYWILIDCVPFAAGHWPRLTTWTTPIAVQNTFRAETSID